MAITRKLLKGMGLTEEQQDTIIEAHTDTVNGLKADVDRYKADAEKLPAVQKELDDLKGKGDDGYKAKYESEHKAFENYKKTVDAEKTTAAKEKAVEAVLKKIGVSEKRLQSVAKLAKADGLLDALELDDDGAVKEVDKLEKSLKDSYSEYITTTSTKGADTPTPPANSVGAKLTMADIYKKDEKGRYVMDYEARLKAIEENLNNQNT
nr:MAG TPA: minor structural protein [Caudoviricetes sp.]